VPIPGNPDDDDDEELVEASAKTYELPLDLKWPTQDWWGDQIG